MMDQYHVIRIQFPSGKTFDHESMIGQPGEAARTATWVSYMDHKMYTGPEGYLRVDRLPEGWGAMSDNEKYAIAIAAGYKPIAVAWYENQMLTWHNAWPEEQ